MKLIQMSRRQALNMLITAFFHTILAEATGVGGEQASC